MYKATILGRVMPVPSALFERVYQRKDGVTVNYERG